MPEPSRQRVLIVDDAPENIRILGASLSDEYEIGFATGGEEALRLAEEQPPDLILLDVQMPDTDGYEVCRRLKELDSTADIPVIFLTAKDAVEDEEKGLGLGAVDYITKPFSLPIVKARIRTHLELKARQDAMLSFLSIASHDLRNPMTVIRLGAELLKRCRTMEQVHTNADRLKDAGRRAEALIETYLAASAATRGSLLVDRSTIDLASLVGEEIEFIRGALSHADKLDFVAKVDCPECEADPQKLRQILANLISNAAKYSPGGGEVRVEVEEVGSEVRFRVSDQGVGMTADDQDQLFTQFKRVGDRKIAGGIGIGLWLTRALVRAHGGQIWVESTPGSGSAFYFTIPR